MYPKITLEEFLNYKNRLIEEFTKISKEAEGLDTSEMSEEEQISMIMEFLKPYTPILEELLQHDLSDIPAEEWDGIMIYNYGDLDLSNTHANFDFKKVEISSDTPINFKGCKISNLNYLQVPLLEECFDQEVIDANPQYFLSSLFSQEFKEKFARRSLLMTDLMELSDEQVKELETKEYKRAITYRNATDKDWGYRTLLDHMALSSLIEIKKQDPTFLSDLAAVYITMGYSIESDYPDLLSGEINIEELKNTIDEAFEKHVRGRFGSSFDDRKFSQEFKSRHQTLFADTEKVSPEIIEKMRGKKISLEDIITHSQELEGIDISMFMEYNYNLHELIEVVGKDFTKLVVAYPDIFRQCEKLISPYNIFSNFKELYWTERAEGTKPIEEVFMNCLLKAHFGKNELEFSPNATEDIYAETFYPDWVKNTGFYLSSLSGMSDYHIPLMSSKTEITNPDIKYLFDTLGFNNIKKMYQEDFFFTPEVINYLVKAIKKLNIEPATSYDDFQEKLIKIMYQAEESNSYVIFKELINMDEESPFRKKYSGLFLPNDAPEELKRIFYTKNPSIIALLQNPEWIPYIKNIDLQKLGIKLPINIINSSINERNTLPPQPFDFLELFLQKNSKEELFDLLKDYYIYLKAQRINIIIDVAYNSAEELKNQLIREIAKNIISNNMIEIDPNSPQEFKEKHPELFLPDNAPDMLKKYFYKRYLTIESLQENPDWIPYLEGVEPRLIKNIPLEVGAVNTEFGPNQMVQILNLEVVYIKEYGLAAYLDFITPYTKTLSSNLLKNAVIDLKDPSKESIETQIEKYIYKCIAEKRAVFSENFPERFKSTYPNIFLPQDAPEELKIKYYSRQLKFEDLRLNPGYKEYFKDMDLVTAFHTDVFTTTTNDVYPQVRISVPKVLEHIDQETLLELISLYGVYFTQLRIRPEFLDSNNIEELKQKIEDEIILSLTLPERKANYITYQENAPQFIKDRLPDYFLDNDAPQELKNYFYQIGPNYQLTVALIGANKEWIPFLKGKRLDIALGKTNNHRQQNIEFIELFGQDQGLKLATNRNETVKVMIETNRVKVMHTWWLKTGKKFIPDYVVMQNIPVEDIDKFLTHGKEWSQLMRNKRFSLTQEGRDSMVKLAYCFGVFDGDTQGYKKLESLLNDVPRKVNEKDMKILLEMEEVILSENANKLTLGKDEYLLLRETLKQEGLEITGPSIFQELYRKNEDGTYTLVINNQMYPKSRELLRGYMEKNNLSMVISADKAHTLFGGFDVKYDRDFREFLLNNLEELITNSDYIKYIPAIQKQFQEIKVVNSNRVLTVDLAVSYVQENKYLNVRTGNDELARVSGMAGYSQSDFEKLQEIYAYGKARVTSSIPRVYGETDKFEYEILRLTDPLAVAIGTLTDCCQELNNAAEVCMEHSMVDKNGRLFLIRDKEGNFVSQSWVWRNGNVLCFDNVEIPDKQLLKSGMARNLIGTGARNELTDEVLAIYKKAAEELIEEDQRVLSALLEAGKITEEQYEQYRLRKVTVGEGYNDIRASIQASFKQDEEKLARPLPFTPPVDLNRGLYVNDSTTQYVLENQPERPQYVDSTLPVHYDDFKVLDKDNITKKDVFILEKLEIAHGRYSYQVNTAVTDLSSSTSIMEEISSNYGTDITTTKIILNPNFAIVFSETPTEIEIVDVITNRNITQEIAQSDKIKLQLKLALLQLAKSGKTINHSSHLYGKELEIIQDIMNISEEEIDKERGISHGI